MSNNRMTNKNILKSRLQINEPVLGTWQVIPSSTVADIIIKAGFDFTIIDMEHGPITYETAEDMVRAIESSGGAPLIRVSKNESSDILKALEIGAHGILVPQIETAQEANEVVDAVKYFPDGNRGFSPFTRSAKYGLSNSLTIGEEKNKETFIGILVEGLEGIKNLEEIVKIKNIDLIYIGKYDLSQSLGIPGDVKNEKVIAKMKECTNIIQENGIAIGTIAGSIDDIKLYKRMGINFIAYKADCALLADACFEIQKKFENIFVE
jgi:4-hydroxy-2-oxoheptanedioate aldolase